MIENHSKAPICIVIPTYFRSECLVKVLDSILALNYPKEKIEVFLAVDSRDMGALKVAEKFKNRGIKIEVIILDVNSATRGRNLGIMRCNSELVAVVDDDVVLHPEAVNVAFKYMRDERVAAVGFPVISLRPSLAEKLHYWRFLGLKSVGVSTVMPVTFFRRSVLYAVGSYREDMGPPLTIHEDWELGSRMRRHGYKILVSGELKMLHLLHIRESDGSRKDDNTAVSRHRWSFLTNKFTGYIKRLVNYSKAYVNKHWWSFFQVLKVSPLYQKLEYAVYYTIPLVAILLLVVDIYWFFEFLVAVLGSIEVYSFVRGYYRVLSVWERLAYPVILILVRIVRSYLALTGLLYSLVEKNK
jgi:glycosyltransferase involved in cell wall biosynthesis